MWIKKNIRDLNDQTEWKMENEKSRREESQCQLTIVFFFGKLVGHFIIRGVELSINLKNVILLSLRTLRSGETKLLNCFRNPTSTFATEKDNTTQGRETTNG